MYKRFAHNQSQILAACEVLTPADFHYILSAQFCNVAYLWPSGVVVSASAARAIDEFNSRIERLMPFYKLVLQREVLCRAIMSDVRALAHEGFLTQYAIYSAEEEVQVAIVNVWPAHLPHSNHFEVPLRLEDLRLGKYFNTCVEPVC